MEKVAAAFQKSSLYAKIATAALSLFLESLVTAFAWIFPWTGLFVCLWLGGVSSYFLTIIFWIGIGVLTFWGLCKISLPSRREIIHRVEASSNLKHRPLSGLADIPATGDSSGFWQLEKQRQRNLLKLLRHSKPDLHLSRRDPYALRIAFLLVVASAFFVAPNDSFDKIHSGIILSGDTSQKEAEPPYAQIRITPPSYSGMTPVILAAATSDKIKVLAGSRISAEVYTDWGKPLLKTSNGATAFNRKKGSAVWTIEEKLPATDKISITVFGIPRFSQKIEFIKDTAPIIGWNGEIKVLPSGEMKLPLKIADDFGIRKLTLRGILAPMQRPAYFGEPIAMEKKANISIRNSSVDINIVFDATGHPWAGRRVSLMVEAEDYAGNISETAPLDYDLPTRNFHNPISILLGNLRNNLLNLFGDVSNIVSGIQEILYRPDLYGWDYMMTLGLRSIDSRLFYDQSKESLESVAATMWQLAMRMEDGNIAETQASLKEALDNLQEALQRNADKAELADLTQKMQQALIRHLQTLAQKMAQNGAMSQQSQSNQNMDLGDLGKFMQDLQRQLMSDNKQSAMEKLNQLQQFAEMLGSSAAQGMPKDMQQMMQSLKDLQSIVAEQKNLIDQTRQSDDQGLKSLSADQNALKERTSSMANKAASKAKDLNAAATEMSLSSNSLQSADKDTSLSHQQKALDLLQQSQKEMQQQLQEKMKGMTMISIGGGSGNQDPLGRPEGTINSGDAEIPQGSARKKSDQIIKTLRERESDMTRPLDERNYYQRLLKQW